MGVFLLFNVKLESSASAPAEDKKKNSICEMKISWQTADASFFQSQFQLQEQKYCNKRKKQIEIILIEKKIEKKNLTAAHCGLSSIRAAKRTTG